MEEAAVGGGVLGLVGAVGDGDDSFSCCTYPSKPTVPLVLPSMFSGCLHSDSIFIDTSFAAATN